MKKILLLFLTIIIFAGGLVCPQSVSATSGYARITTDDTPFYSDALGLNLVYFLPYTYYVRVLDDDGYMAHVECVGENFTSIDGYVPLSALYFDNQPVTTSYVNVKITTADTAVLYGDSNYNDTIQYVFSGRQLTYYGSLPKANGEILYYVSYNGRLGYVKESSVIPFVVPNHPNPLTFIQETIVPDTPENNETPSDTNSDNSTTSDSLFNMRYIIIFCLLFAGIIGLALVFSKKTPDKNKATACGYYDENDFE